MSESRELFLLWLRNRDTGRELPLCRVCSRTSYEEFARRAQITPLTEVFFPPEHGWEEALDQFLRAEPRREPRSAEEQRVVEEQLRAFLARDPLEGAGSVSSSRRDGSDAS